MYSYQKSTASKRHESFVPKRTSTLQLVDNRPESIIQRKRKTAVNTTNVIQLGTNKKYKKATKKTTSNKVKKKKDPFARPAFTTDSKKSAMLHHNTFGKHDFTIDLKKPDLPSYNAAQPHRFPWRDIRETVRNYHIKGNKRNAKKYKLLISFLRKSGERRIRGIERRLKHSVEINDIKKIKAREELLKRAQNSQNSFEKSYKNYENNNNEKNLTELLKQANSHHGNVPDYGPHHGVNNPVSDAIHLNLRESRKRKRTHKKNPHPRSPSPTSRRLLRKLIPTMTGKGIAVTTDGKIITTSGDAVHTSLLSPYIQQKVARFKKVVVKGYLPNAPFGSEYVKGQNYN